MNETFGQRLQKALQYAGLSQSDVARAIKIKPQAIQYLCAGKAKSSRYATQIAKVCNVDPDWLATGKGVMIKDTLSDDERAMLELYRQLSSKNKAAIREVVSALSEYKIDSQCG